MPDSIIKQLTGNDIIINAENNINTIYTALCEGLEGFILIPPDSDYDDIAEYLLDNYGLAFLSSMLLYMHKQWPELFDSTPMQSQENTVESFKVYNLREYLAFHGVTCTANPYFCIVSNDPNFAKLIGTMINNKTQGQAFIEKLTEKPGAYNAFIEPIGGVESSLYNEAYSKKSWNYAYPIIQFSV